jgi:hypothetical protein
VFLSGDILPDNKLVNIASADAYHFGILSSRIHSSWALSVGSKRGLGAVYVKSVCFDAFPFPSATERQMVVIRRLAEELSTHREARQALHSHLTLTSMYNVLEALRRGRELTDDETHVHQLGQISVLLKLHDELDAAVADAYGWPGDLVGDEILSRLAALHAVRAEEEKQGMVRWLRPDYQAPQAQAHRAQAHRARATGARLRLDDRL